MTYSVPRLQVPFRKMLLLFTESSLYPFPIPQVEGPPLVACLSPPGAIENVLCQGDGDSLITEEC